MKNIILACALFFSFLTHASVIIDLYGDSTQYGSELVDGVYVRSEKPPSAVLQDRMDEEFGAGSVEVRNKGIGGTTIAQQYFGQAPYVRTWAAEMAASDAHIVIDNHGINDAFLSYMRPADYLWVHNMMSAAAQAAGKIYYVETPNLINNPANAKLLSFLLQGLYPLPRTPGTRVIDTYGFMAEAWPYWKQRLPDGIHPNAELYRYKGDRLFYELQPVVKTMLGL